MSDFPIGKIENLLTRGMYPSTVDSMVEEVTARVLEALDENKTVEWSIKLRKIDNGFLLTDDNGLYECLECDTRETFGIFLERIADFFGEGYNKFRKDNLNITWDKKGHKCE